MSSALKKHKRATVGLGTIIEVTLWLPAQQDPTSAFKQAYQAISTVHAHMSVHDDKSDLGRYRLSPHGARVPMCAATIEVLRFSEMLFVQSQGYFDVCIGGTLAKAAYLPPTFSTNAHHHARTQSLDIEQIDAEGNGLVRKIPNTMIDLGGIAKGYAVDYAIQTLQSLNIPAALVNAGGDMRIYGEVAAPIHLRKDNQYIYLKDLKNRALASSGMPTNTTTPVDALPIVNPILGTCLPSSDNVISIEADQAMVADAFTKLAWLNRLDETLLNRYNATLVS